MQEGGADYGSDGGFGSGSSMEPRRGKAGSGAKAGFDSAIDDEIPF
jgi:single-strand DNA-binding protein